MGDRLVDLSEPFVVRTDRMPWRSATTELVNAVERLLGSPVAEARDRSGGFSRGIAGSLRCADGSRAFVKAVRVNDDAFAASLYESEAEIAGRMPVFLPTPRFLGRVDVDGWVALAFEDVDGVMPALPWRADDLAAMASTLVRLAESATPSPIAGLRRWGDDPARWHGWQAMLAADGVPLDAPPGSAEHADQLAAMEGQYTAISDGNTLLHSDLRADNILVSSRGVVLVDWAHAAVGAAWVDPVIFALSAAAQGHPDPEALLCSTPIGAAADVDAVNAVLAMLAGRFVAIVGTPGPERVREFQRREAHATMRWLAERLKWQ